MTVDFRHVTTWVFDLDNTLYPPEIRLFDQIEVRMTAFVQEFLGVDAATANRLRAEYWASHGTTLAGLMDLHGMEPHAFLDHVHDIDFSVLPPDPDLAQTIHDLPGRKVIYTNGTAPYARDVLTARGLLEPFDAIFGVEDAGFRPKPERVAFECVFAKAGIDPTTAAFFEDEIRNLEVPQAMGMRCVHVGPVAAVEPYVDISAPNLLGVLSQLHAHGFSLPRGRLGDMA